MRWKMESKESYAMVLWCLHHNTMAMINTHSINLLCSSFYYKNKVLLFRNQVI